jgi:signal transduction histidine kinase
MVILTREQLEERLAALHQASLELVGDLSLENVLERIVMLAREQVTANYAALGVVDEKGNLVNFIPVGMSQEEIEATGAPPVGKGMIGALQKERRTIRASDLHLDPHSEGFPHGHPNMNSFLGVPILQGERLLGQIYLTNKQDNQEFSEADERVIETLAAYAAIAINNARLYEDLVARDQTLQRRNEDLALINDIAASLTATLDAEQVLDKTLQRVMSYLDVDAGEIFLREDDEQTFRVEIHRGEYAEAFLTKSRFKIGEGYIGKVAESGQPQVSVNLKQDIQFLRPAVVEAGIRSIACIPLTARGEVIGVMSVASRNERRFNQREIDILTSIGTWTGITIENANLHWQARRVAILEERERIGMDLHDGIIQSIYAVGLALDYARVSVNEDPIKSQQKIEQAIEGLNKTILDIRSYILDLRPYQFTGDSLRDGLRQLIDEFRANTLSEANLNAPDDNLTYLPTSHATALFHICQEALANAAKHSQARRTRVKLWKTNERFLLEVSDNGQGFDLNKTSITLGHGLSNMHIRARKVGGDVDITSAPQEGTTVLAWVPRRAQ